MAEYNTKASHLESAIESILQQTFRDFEFLIVDDGSPTDVAAIASQYDDARVRVLSYGENRGFVAALNFGISHARGAYIARMDTDDIAEPYYIETVLRFLQSHPEYSVVSGQALEFSADRTPHLLGRPGELTASRLMRGNTPIHPATMIRTDAIREAGGYRNLKRAEDLALWFELALRGHKLFLVPTTVIKYRVDHSDFRKRKLRYRRDEIAVRWHYYPRLGAGPIEYLQILKSIISGVLPIGLVRRARSILHRSI